RLVPGRDDRPGLYAHLRLSHAGWARHDLLLGLWHLLTESERMALFDFLGNPVGVGNMTWGGLAQRAAAPQAPTQWMPPPTMGPLGMPQVPGVQQLPGSPLRPMGGGADSTGKVVGAVQDLNKIFSGAGAGAGAAAGTAGTGAALTEALEAGGSTAAAAGAGTEAAATAAPSIWSQIGSWLLALL